MVLFFVHLRYNQLNINKMEYVKTLNKWANKHSYYILDIARICLGLFIFMKALTFMADTEMLIKLFKPIDNLTLSIIAFHYIVPAHIIGGLLIIFGLLTRWAVIAQLPLIIGAIAVNFVGERIVIELIEANIALILCIFFLCFGSGKHSADYYFKMQQ